MALNLTITRAKTALFQLTVTQSDGVAPQSLSGGVLWFHAAINTLSIDKHSPSNGIVITDSAGGLATLQIDPADTEALSEGATAVMPCELTLVVGSASYELNTGVLTVVGNVGTP